jgi:hypothetical protein
MGLAVRSWRTAGSPMSESPGRVANGVVFHLTGALKVGSPLSHKIGIANIQY